MIVRFRPAVAVSLIAAVSLAAVGCSSGAKYDTPEDCFQTIRMAAHDEDIPTFYDSLTADSQDVLAGALVMLSVKLKAEVGLAGLLGSAARGAEAKQELEAVNPILARHGATDDAINRLLPDAGFSDRSQGLANMAALIDDKRAFVADMYAAMKQFSGADSFAKELTEQLAGEIQDVAIEGNRATAIVVTESGEEPLVFHKTAAGWKLHISAEDLMPAEYAFRTAAAPPSDVYDPSPA
jgi:hypothetical protein